MEIKQRMSKRFAWLLGAVVLVAIGLLVACSSNYNSSSDGLVLVGSQGSALIETYSFNLGNGHISGVANPPSSTSNSTCVLPGLPSSIVMDPKGAYAYAILTQNSTCSGSATGIAAFKVNSDGTTTAVGSLVTDPNPVALAMDAAGKFLFVAEGIAGLVSSYAIGSGGSLTAVAGTFNFVLPAGFQNPNIVAIAPTPSVFPALGINGVQNAVCSQAGNNAPTTEYLYAADMQNNVVWEFGVDMSSGALENPGLNSSVQNIVAGSQPSGVAVDACDRFVFVGNYLSNQVSAYTICNGSTTQSTACLAEDGTLTAVSGSPYPLPGSANGPGPIAVDPYGNYVYVVEKDSSTITPFHISPVTGSLTSGAVVATGQKPVALAIRADDNWLFVANYNSATISQYSITPSTGALAPSPAVTTDNYPAGVAVR